ncbi:hypothetical protein JTB14_003223 [Gonioctena quinquepunctata]|nr:hypothetical protein JTB14_003223 [Gonioctena quinquepunctata]
MSHVRFSFFGNLFEDEKNKKLSKEENEILTNLIGTKKQDPGLFESVKSTLSTLQEIPGEPFLMVVFGGHFSEICDKSSPLVQTLKHVSESTDPKSTLIVLTGACPNDTCEGKKDGNNLVIIKESFRSDSSKDNINAVFPVYAKGPKSDVLTKCTVLYDMPLILKDILEEISPTFGVRN